MTEQIHKLAHLSLPSFSIQAHSVHIYTYFKIEVIFSQVGKSYELNLPLASYVKSECEINLQIDWKKFQIALL